MRTALLVLYFFMAVAKVDAQTLPRRPFLGVRMEPLSEARAAELGADTTAGVVISNVFAGSTAEAAGLRTGDLLLLVGDQATASPNEVVALVRKFQVGETVKFTVLRSDPFIDEQIVTLQGELKPFPTIEPAGVRLHYGALDAGGGATVRTLTAFPLQGPSQKSPAILFIQGVGCYSLDTPFDTATAENRLVHDLTRQGFITLRADKPGLGDSQGGTPCSRLDFDSEAELYRRALRALRATPGVDTANIFIIGHSMGGVFAPLLAREIPVKGIVAYGTIGVNFMEYFTDSRRTIAQAYSMKPDEADDYVRRACDCAYRYIALGQSADAVIQAKPDCAETVRGLEESRPHDFWLQLNRLNIPALWAGYRGRVLAAWGRGDYISTRKEHELIVEAVNSAAQAPRATFLQIDGAEHGMHRAGTFQEAIRNAGIYQPAVGMAISTWLRDAVPATAADKKPRTLTELTRSFVDDYQGAGIADLDFDYRENLRQIASLAVLDERLALIDRYNAALRTVDTATLSAAEKARYHHLAYVLGLNRERFTLEKRFRENPPGAIPDDGLARLPGGRDWYHFYIRYWTGVDLSPEAVFAYGKTEVARVQREIAKIRARRGFARDSAGFYRHLETPEFFLTDEAAIRAAYDARKATVLAHLDRWFEPRAVPDIGYRQWPNAGPFTPPGIYLGAENNDTGKPLFQYNFAGGRHPRRAMDWLFLHEAIPGHHYHTAVRRDAADALNNLYFVSGTAEGWATYVEYFGDQFGLYQDDYAWLGKWEWDLVRSVRVVLSVGINYYGWTKEEALAYWKANVPGQDAIAEREIVNRCTHWGGQVLTYKIGAKKIFELRAAEQQRLGAAFEVRKFHTRFLETGLVPLDVMAGYLAAG